MEMSKLWPPPLMEGVMSAGRNLAVLLEAAVRATVLKLRGIDSMQEFVDRQEAALRADAGNNGVN